MDLIFNTPNQDVLPGYLKLGWQHVATVRPLIKVLSYPGLALGLVRSCLGKQSYQQYSLTEFFREGPTPVSAMLEDQQAVERLIQQNGQRCQAPGAIRTRQSWEYLRWRYGEHPTIPYWAVVREQGGHLRGCVIFRANTRYGLREVVLSELLLAEPDQKLAFSLLEQLRTGIRADYLIAHFQPGSFQRRTLNRWGFRTVPRQGMNFTVRTLAPDLPLDPQLFDSWSLSMGDLAFF